MTAIYHITHIDNLPRIVGDGRLWSDVERIARALANVRIGYEHIKERRRRRKVAAAAGGVLGDYVPFYFCPRSVMLYLISQGRVDGYAGGQHEVVHLVSSVGAAIALGRAWAFTRLHAELAEADPYLEDTAELNQLQWPIIRSNSWGGDERRKFKQAEFLVHEQFAWNAVAEIGVATPVARTRVAAILAAAGGPQPPVVVRPDWYY
jgi:hypothetical protein